MSDGGKKVHSLRGDPLPLAYREPVEDVIQMVDELLSQARDGKLRALVYVGYDDTNRILYGHRGEIDTVTILGGLERARHRFNKMADELDLA